MEENEKKENEGLSSVTFGELNTDTSYEAPQETPVYTPEWNVSKSSSYDSHDSFYSEKKIQYDQPENESKALDICTLVFGILSIVCCCGGGLFGFVGFVLGIIALVKGKRSGILIAGFVCSIIGLLIAMAILVYSITPGGKENWSDFAEEFQREYERSYNRDSESSDISELTDGFDSQSLDDEYEEYGEDESEMNDASVAEKVKIISINGTQISLPCKLEDLPTDISAKAEEEKSELIDAIQEDNFYSLDIDIDSESISLDLTKQDEKTAIDIKELDVVSIQSSDVSGNQGNTEFFNGIKAGDTREELEQKLGDVHYKKDEDLEYYSFEAGAMNEYLVYIYMMDEKVVQVSVDYFGAVE